MLPALEGGIVLYDRASQRFKGISEIRAVRREILLTGEPRCGESRTSVSAGGAWKSAQQE